jgi:hypothetical protein
MPDMLLIQSAITGLKTAADIAKGFLQLRSMAEVQVQVSGMAAQTLSTFPKNFIFYFP